jgi:hypothetical protein
MNDNDVEKIEHKVFHPLKKLRRLYLNNNHITQLHFLTFRRVKALRYLFLENNKIIYIDPRLFKHVTKLKVLDISRNKLTELEPTTFQNNRILSWINIRHNSYIDTLDWKPLFKHSFNFRYIKFCDDKIYSYGVYAGASTVGRNLEEYPYTNSPLTKELYKGNDRLGTVENLVKRYLFMKPVDMNFEDYDILIRTIGYDEYNTIISRENYYVTILTDYPIFCYCKSKSLWFWCHDLEAYCSSKMSILVMLTATECSSHAAHKLHLPTSVLPNSTTSRGERKSRENEVLINDGKTGANSSNTENIVIYALMAIGVVIIMVL